MPKDFLYLIITIFPFIIVIFFSYKDYKRDRDKITFLNKKALAVSVLMFVLVFFGFLSMEKNVAITIFFSFWAFWLCYVFLWLIFDDPKYPDGNSDFEHNVQFVLEVQKNNYKVPFSGTVGMYKRAKHDMEQYMIKHGIAKIGIGGNGFGQIYYEFESLEAKDKYFQNVRKPAPEDNFW